MSAERKRVLRPRVRPQLAPTLPPVRPAEYARKGEAAESGVVINRRGKVVAGMIVAAMLASLGACSAGTPAAAGSAAAAPGTFNVQLHGEIVNAVGTAQP